MKSIWNIIDEPFAFLNIPYFNDSFTRIFAFALIVCASTSSVYNRGFQQQYSIFLSRYAH